MSQILLYHHLVEGCLVTKEHDFFKFPLGVNASHLRPNKDCKRFDKDTFNAGINEASYKLRCISNCYLVDGGEEGGTISKVVMTILSWPLEIYAPTTQK